jgi:hypothetical protein
VDFLRQCADVHLRLLYAEAEPTATGPRTAPALRQCHTQLEDDVLHAEAERTYPNLEEPMASPAWL